MSEISDVSGTVEVTSLGAKGDGLSEAGAIAYTLPGDIVENGRIATPSPHRVTPECRHFGTCGGCLLQHASDEFMAAWKTGIVTQALRSRGLPETIARIHSSPARARRRAVFSGRRTKKTVQLGFFARGSDVLVPISECPLIVPEIEQAFEALKAVVRLAATRNSVVKLAVATSDAGLDVAVTGAVVLERSGLEALAEIGSGFARVSWNGEVVLMRAPPSRRFGLAAVTPPAGAFLQATQDGEAALVDAVLRNVGAVDKVMDLFAGCGTFALPLAASAHVHAVEFEPDMVAALDAGWRQAPGLKRVSVEARDLFRRPMLAPELKGYDAVVLDPPRAGAAAQVAELAHSDVSRVVHVSCNPVTFARDAGSLVDAGFELYEVEVVDQFKWSPHVELVGSFTR